MDKIILLARETYSEGQNDTLASIHATYRSFIGKTQFDEPEDKLVGKLAITYGVLRRLGFSEDRVEECLKSANGIGLEDAYAWVSNLCPINVVSGELGTALY